MTNGGDIPVTSIYKKKGDLPAIGMNNTWTPIFNFGFSLRDNYLTSKSHSVQNKINSQTNWHNFEKDFELNNGKEYFEIEDVDAYEINY